MIEQARRSLIEIPNERLRQEGKVLVDESTGERFEIARGFIDFANVGFQAPQVIAFSVRDGYVVPFTLEGNNHPPETSQYMGSLAPVKVGSSAGRATTARTFSEKETTR